MAASSVEEEERSDNGRAVARMRWKLLADVVASRMKNHVPNTGVSVRSFERFQLLNVAKIECQDTNRNKETKVYRFSCPRFNINVDVRLLPHTIDLRDLVGFNNTGNLCVWPSEEVLAFYCMKHSNVFSGKMVCELGGGMTCLAGIMLAMSSDVTEILLTDGNLQSAKNIELVITENEGKFGSTVVKSKLLRWDKIEDTTNLQEHFDCVLCADCLFFEDSLPHLANAIFAMLKINGYALITAPSRSGSFQKFFEVASQLFDASVDERYDAEIWNMHQKFLIENDVYKPDLHYPLLMVLRKCK